MIIRRPVSTDVLEIMDIAGKYDFPLVDKFEEAAVAVDGDKIRAFGVVRTILEIVLYCDGSDRDKIKAIRKLLDTAKNDAERLGHDQLYAFVEEDFAKILIKSFGFREAQGTTIILDL